MGPPAVQRVGELRVRRVALVDLSVGEALVKFMGKNGEIIPIPEHTSTTQSLTPYESVQTCTSWVQAASSSTGVSSAWRGYIESREWGYCISPG